MTRATLLWAILLSFSAVGCVSDPAEPGFDHLTYAEVSLAPIEARLEPNRVTLTEGIAVKAKVRAIDDQGDAMSGTVRLEPLDPNVLDVMSGPDGTLVFVGMADGKTSLDVFVGSRHVGQVEATVEPQL